VTHSRSRTISIVFKIASRCNLNCSYCYVYNMRDKSFAMQPRFVTDAVVQDLVRFLVDGIPAENFRGVQVIFHGGEPLLAGPKRFASIANALTAGLGEKLELALQTNATLVDQRWLDLFEQFRVGVGVSLDGPELANDAARRTRVGGGSYQAAAKGIRSLVAAHAEGRLRSLGLLCVINPERDPAKLLDHFVDDLGVELLDFLLPDATHQDAPDAEAVGRYLIRLFDSWICRNNPRVRVRILSSILSVLLGGRSRMIGFGGEDPLALTVNTDGSVSPDDTLRGCGTEIMNTGCSVSNHTLEEVLTTDRLRQVRGALKRPAAECRSCEWLAVCGGSHLVNRFDASNGFDNPSVLCDGLKLAYWHVARFLAMSGYATHVEATLRDGPSRFDPGMTTSTWRDAIGKRVLAD
jgi:uncharacterized protein